jgi:predicted methyltransferase
MRETKATAEGDERRASVVRRGVGGLVQMLTQLCRKMSVKCILYVNYKPLPVVAAVKKAQHLLERGEAVTIMLENRSVKITAKSLEELRDKIAQLLK